MKTELIARQPWVATSTDAGIALPGDGGKLTHPRAGKVLAP